MDDTGGDDLDSGLHGDQLRLLRLLVEPEVGDGDLAGAAELPGRGVGSREGVRVVLGPGAHVPAAVGGHVHVGVHGAHRLRHPVARHQGNPNATLHPGTLSLRHKLQAMIRFSLITTTKDQPRKHFPAFV